MRRSKMEELLWNMHLWRGNDKPYQGTRRLCHIHGVQKVRGANRRRLYCIQALRRLYSRFESVIMIDRKEAWYHTSGGIRDCYECIHSTDSSEHRDKLYCKARSVGVFDMIKAARHCSTYKKAMDRIKAWSNIQPDKPEEESCWNCIKSAFMKVDKSQGIMTSPIDLFCTKKGTRILQSSSSKPNCLFFLAK